MNFEKEKKNFSLKNILYSFSFKSNHKYERTITKKKINKQKRDIEREKENRQKAYSIT